MYTSYLRIWACSICSLTHTHTHTHTNVKTHECIHSMPGDEAQLIAADELHCRGWMYHKRLRMWILHVPNTLPQKSVRGERGAFVVFNHSGGSRVGCCFTVRVVGGVGVYACVGACTYCSLWAAYLAIKTSLIVCLRGGSEIDVCPEPLAAQRLDYSLPAQCSYARALSFVSHSNVYSTT